jgi:hypothetical protein
VAEHAVTLTTTAEIVLGNVDYVFKVYADNEKFGELHISRGGVDWWPRDAKIGHAITWEQFYAMWERYSGSA